MLASLQLFHDIPCRIMDLIFSVITHPNFDLAQLTIRKSTDVIDIVEESRMKDRMSVVHNRSLGHNGRTEQAGFPQFVLDEVLDIVHAERIARVKSTFNDIGNMEVVYRSVYHSEEDWLLKEMSLVHRSWTFPSQKALGRVLFINNPARSSYILHSPASVRKSIFGPWTTVVAFQMFCCLNEEDCDDYFFLDHFQEEYQQWFENLHRILVGFTNLRSVWIQSYAEAFTKWANFTIEELVRRNINLRDLTLHTQQYKDPFILDPLVECSRNLRQLRTLDIERARFSDSIEGQPVHGTGVMYLNSLTIEFTSSSLESELEMLRIISTLSNPSLELLHIIYSYSSDSNFEEITARLFTPTQCALSFEQLRSLRINSNETAAQWLKWIVPYSSNLKHITLDVDMLSTADTLSLIPKSISSLELQVGNTTSWGDIEPITGWMRHILEFFSSGHLSGLKSFSLIVPKRLYVYNLDYNLYKSIREEAENLLSQIRNFKESMGYLCESAGIECSLNL